MKGRWRRALIAVIAGVLVAALVIALTGAPSDRRAAVVRDQSGLSFKDEERIFDGRIQLSNHCFRAIQSSRGQASTPSPQETEATARATVDEILRLAREHPSAHVSEVGSMRTALTNAARDLEHPACLPDEARRLRAAATRLPH
jgi:hypothetical protein